MEEKESEKIGNVYKKLREYILEEAKELGLEASYESGYENKSEIEMPVTFTNNLFSISLLHTDAGKSLVKTMTLGGLRELEALDNILEDEDLRKLYFQELFDTDFLDSQKQKETQYYLENEEQREAA